MRRETGDMRQENCETLDLRQETGDRRCETVNGRQDTGDGFLTSYQELLVLLI